MADSVQSLTPVRRSRRRTAVVMGTAAALAASLVGGTLLLTLSGEHASTPVALEPIVPEVPASPAPIGEPGVPDAEPAGLTDGLGSSDALAPSGSLGSPASLDSPASGMLAAPAGSGGSLALPPPPPALPSGSPVDWAALIAPLVKAQEDVNAANLAGAIAGPTIGAVVAVGNTAAVLLGDVILYAALNNNGQSILTQLQGALAATPGAAAAVAAATANASPVPDFTGLAAAFASASELPFGAPGLPILPELPALPALPPPEQFLAGLTALPALGMPGLPPIELPPPPGLPQLPRPEEVVGGVVALGVAGAVVGALVPKPPSITRLLGLPF